MDLADYVSARASELGVPGVAVGVLVDGQQHVACHGVTSVENPLLVTPATLFQFGSIGKTYTATAAVILAERGRLDLDAPVRRYLPDLRLADEDVARRVTTRHLLTHTGGWDGDFELDTGEGDGALAAYVAALADLEQVSPLGARASYSNSGFALAGRVIEAVTGTTYEQAIADLLFTPLGLGESFFFARDVLSRRFAVGHNQREDGPPDVVRPPTGARALNPAGGIAASITDQLRWARFHLAGNDDVLSGPALAAMRRPGVALRGSSLGDAIGISWFLREVDGVQIAGHGGTLNGQYSELRLVPERGFAVVSATNSGPNGLQFNQELLRWALRNYLGIDERDPEPAPRADAELRGYAGRYETGATTLGVTVDDGGLVATFDIKPEVLAELGDAAPHYPPFRLGLLPDRDDEYVVVGGPANGLRGYFDRDPAGRVTVVDFSGRLHTRAEESA